MTEEDFQVQLANRDRVQAEIFKLNAETGKLAAERQKLDAENIKLVGEAQKLYAEGSKFEREKTTMLITALAAFGGTMALVGSLITKLLGH